MKVTHAACGGEVDTDARHPSCSKCGWSLATVEKDNIKKAQKAASSKPWWNTKRFSSEKEALNYSSPKATSAYVNANSVLMSALESGDAKTFAVAKKLYAKAVDVALGDDDVVAAAIFESMIPEIDQHQLRHQETAGSQHGRAVRDGDGAKAG